MAEDVRNLYVDALGTLLAGDMAKLVAARNFRLLAEVARLAHEDAPIDLAVTDRALYQAWRNAVTLFHLRGWTYMTPERVHAVATLDASRRADPVPQASAGRFQSS
jgi:hypothetical protein